MLANITSPYSAAESWAYDRFIAPAVAALADRLLPELGHLLPDRGRLLDVGCGGGQNLVAISRARPDARLQGIDLSSEQIRRASARAADAGIDAAFTVGSALDLPFGDGEFDLVLSVASIKHWPDQARGVAECARVARPGGHVLILEGDRGCKLEDARRFVERWRLPLPMRWPSLLFFRTYVAGQALDVDEARALLSGAHLDDPHVERLEGLPALVMRGRKPAGAVS